MRRWFVDPLTSFDAGAIALAVAERRNRQPKTFVAGRAPRVMPPLGSKREEAAAFPEEIDDAEADRLAGELEVEIAELINGTHGEQNEKRTCLKQLVTEC